jgi:hypothetical protein
LADVAPSMTEVTMAKSKASAKPKPQQTQPDSAISEEMIDKTLEDSFPASDPPSWTTGRERSDPPPAERHRKQSNRQRKK